MIYPPSFIACDLETSGLDPKSDAIIEVGLVRVDDGCLTADYHTLVRPRRPLARKIKRLTGLDDADFAGSPEWDAVRGPVLDFIGDLPLVGHNVTFDINFLWTHAGFRPQEAFDTCELARVVRSGLVNYRLETICVDLGVEYPVQHRALADATATALAYLSLCERAAALDPALLADLTALFAQGGSPWFPFFDQSYKQASAAFGASKMGTGYGPDEPRVPEMPGGDSEISTLPAVDDLLGPTGTLAGRLPAYEFRPPQLEMARSVGEALAAQEILMVEAGTGTGKSFAYLIPGVLWAKKQEERVVVSTHTVNLQDQLIRKDVPVLREELPPFRVCLLKGRSNYLCRRRWHETVKGGAFDPPEALTLARIMVWLRTTPTTGDRSELGLMWHEREVWQKVAASSDGCMGSACRFHARCFVTRARRRAERAEVIITNHSLLLSDLKTENRLLPSFGALIIDEAHHLEDAATTQLGRRVTGSDFRHWAEGIRKLAAKINKSHPEIAPSLQWVEKKVKPAVTRLFRALTRACAFGSEGAPSELRLGPGAANLAAGVAEQGAQVQEVLEDGLDRLQRAYHLLVDQTMAGTAEDLLTRFELLLKDGRKAAEDLIYILAGDNADDVFWAARIPRRSTDCMLHAAPIMVDELLFNGLFNGTRPVVLTSATLTVAGSFDYFSRRTGVDLVAPDVRRSLQLDSPFFYADQARLFVVDDLPTPIGGGGKDYADGLCRGIGELVLAAQGRTLVLFTAHRVLKEVYHRLKPVLEEAHIDLLGHLIDGGRARLLEAFRADEKAVLFGASSFWEGVDIPGPALSSLIIVKLPFQPPYRPVTAARREMIKSRGESDFSALSLPEAVLRFKQGFGRLIRQSTDSGVAVVLDDRVVTKPYGARFLRSLPLKAEAAPLATVAAGMSAFLPPPVKAGTTGDRS